MHGQVQNIETLFEESFLLPLVKVTLTVKKTCKTWRHDEMNTFQIQINRLRNITGHGERAELGSRDTEVNYIERMDAFLLASSCFLWRGWILSHR